MAAGPEKGITMKRGMIIIVLVAAAAFGAHHYYTRQIEQGLDDLALQAQMIGRLDYADVTIVPTGAVRVEHVRFRAHNGPEAFRLDSITFRAANLWALWRMSGELEDGRLPRELAVEVEGLRLPRSHGTFSASGGASQGTLSGLDAAGCGDREYFTEVDLTRMGYTHPIADVSLDYRLIGGGERLAVAMTGAVQELGEVDIGIDLELGARSRSAAEIMMGLMTAGLERIDFRYRDLGYAERVMALCMAETGLDADAYRERHVAAWDRSLKAHGLMAGPGLRGAYERFAADPREFGLVLRPVRRLGLGSAGDLAPATLLRELDGTIRVNGETAGDFDLRAMRASERAAYRAAHGTTAEDGDDPAAGDDTTSGPVVDERADGMRVVARAELGVVEGRRAVVRLVGGRELNGRIEGVEGDRLQLRRRMSGGYVVMPYPLAEIDEVLVRR